MELHELYDLLQLQPAELFEHVLVTAVERNQTITWKLEKRQFVVVLQCDSLEWLEEWYLAQPVSNRLADSVQLEDTLEQD